jgi:hypothetical protein
MSGDNERDALHASNDMGRWSFAQQATLGSSQTGLSQPLVTVQGMDAWDAKPWQLSLNAWRFSGGDVGGVSAIPPENRIYSLSNVFATVEWGVDGMNEVVDVDWPPSGCSVQFNAAFVRVSVKWMFDFLNAAPLLQGFVSPGHRLNQMAVNPRYTDARVISDNTFQRIPRPRRAVAYRVQFNAVKVGQTYTLAQEGAAGGGANFGVTQDGTHSEDVVANPDMTPDARAGWIPIASRTQSITIVTSLTGGNLFLFEFLLDLG